MSGHGFIFNKKQDVVKHLTPSNWTTLNKSMCDAFYNEYKTELAHYDGFICTYPPSFSLLYEKFNKPIIIQAPIRFEVPFQNDPDRLKWFIDYLKQGIDNKQIIPVANSLYEKEYCEHFTDREWHFIPNICDYTNIDCQGGENYLLYSKVNISANHPNILNKPASYNWSIFNNLRGIIHFPYNISTMSIFEQYTGNVPLIFPTPEFCIELYKQNLALSELSWTSNKLDSMEWVKKADFYNQEWMPHITYFSSRDNLREIVDSIEHKSIIYNMKEFNMLRKERIYKLWDEILMGVI